MTGARLLIVSDTHLSDEAAPEARANWEAVVAHVEADRPDVVVHLGDLTLDGSHRDADLTAARRQLDRLPVEWCAIPGNHDVGDNPYAGQAEGQAIDVHRRDRWIAEVGPDWWSLDFDGWTLLGVHAQLFSSGLDAAAEQWEWLAERLRTAKTPVVLLSHKPLVAPVEELAVAPPYRFVPAEMWPRLAPLLSGVALVMSGHVHQHRTLVHDGVRHEWAPTTWAVLPDADQPIFGAKVCGVLSLDLRPAEAPDVRLVRPPGLRQLTLRRDVVDPYAH